MQTTFIIISLLTGGTTGWILGLFFFQMDSFWKKTMYLIISAGTVPGFSIISNLLIENEAARKDILFIVFYSFAIICFIVTIMVYKKVLNNQDDKFKLRWIDILIGRKKTLEEYYNARKLEIDDIYSIDKMNAKEKELDDKRLVNEDFEKSISHNLVQLREESQGKLKLPIISEHDVLFTENLLNFIPEYTGVLFYYIIALQNSTNDFIDKIDKAKLNTKKQKQSFLRGYFREVCEITCFSLRYNLKNIRVFFRFLDSNDEYVTFTSSYNKEEYKKPITKFKKGEGMIFNAGVYRRSLIKSLNLRFHKKGKNDHYWRDYMTVVFPEFIIDNDPVFTLTLSVRSETEYEQELKFLNYIKIEELIQENFKKFNEKLDITQIFRNYE